MNAGKVKICHPIGIAVLKDVPAVDAEYLISHENFSLIFRHPI